MSTEPKESNRYTMVIIDFEQPILNIKGHKYIKAPDPAYSTIEIEDRKYIRVHDFTSKQTMNELNYHYLSTCPVSELLWFLDNIVALLKEKAIKLELPAE